MGYEREHWATNGCLCHGVCIHLSILSVKFALDGRMWLTSMFPQVVTTLKPMYPRELRTTIGVAGRLIPWGGLDGGGLWDIVKLALNLL